jgi:hypothetical protein
MFELLRELREFLEASTTGTLGHFRKPRVGDQNPRFKRFDKLGRKHAAQHALGHSHAKGDVHDVHGKSHIHKGKVKQTKTGKSYAGKKIATPKLRKGATRHLAARARLAKMKWQARAKKISFLKKKGSQKAKVGVMRRKVA